MNHLEPGREHKGDLEVLESLGTFFRRGVERLLRRTRATLVVLSSRMRQEMAESGFGLPVLRIPNGVDMTRFAPRDGPVDREERARTVVYVGRLDYQKGVDVLLEAWERVHAEMPQARLVIVGTGPVSHQLECLGERLSIADSIEFTGVQGDTPAQYHRAGLAVLPSRWEGMPNAVLEAMACGIPCVATRVSGSEDIIDDGINGLLVEPEDREGLARAMLTLLHNPSLAEEYGSAAVRTIHQHYSLDHVIDRYAELYDNLGRRT